MSELMIRASEQDTGDGKTTVAAELELPDGRHRIWFRGPEGGIRARGGDAFVITCLPTAMRQGLDMVVEDPVSPRLLIGMATAQDILCQWHRDFQRIEIHAEAAAPALPSSVAPAAAAFFSGGVDSFHTALANRESISALVLVHGFDLPLANLELRARVSRAIGEAAQDLDKRLIEVETNSRSFSDERANWVFHQFGPALAGIASLLEGYDRILIPSSESYARLDACASHPLLDPLWSTEYATVVHDGAAFNRSQKLGAISRDPVALRWLRVCWTNPANAYNCGLCEKCIRTMLSLEASGALGRCSGFDAPLTAKRVAALRIPNHLVLYHLQECLEAMRERRARPDLIAALAGVLGRYEARRALAAMRVLPRWSLLDPALLREIGRDGEARIQRGVRRGLRRFAERMRPS